MTPAYASIQLFLASRKAYGVKLVSVNEEAAAGVMKYSFSYSSAIGSNAAATALEVAPTRMSIPSVSIAEIAAVAA